MCRYFRQAFTLIELLIVVVILAILAAVVIPQFSDAASDAKLSQLQSDLWTMREGIARYRFEHDGRGPHMLPNKSTDPDTNNFVLRLTSRTRATGQVDLGPPGKLGPYLKSFAGNPFTSDTSEAGKVTYGTGNPPSGTTGWYFNTNSGQLFANTSGHENL